MRSRVAPSGPNFARKQAGDGLRPTPDTDPITDQAFKVDFTLTRGRHVMHIKQYAASILGLLVLLRRASTRNERGLSQSAEGAILIGAAVAVALVIAVFLKGYVSSHLPN